VGCRPGCVTGAFARKGKLQGDFCSFAREVGALAIQPSLESRRAIDNEARQKLAAITSMRGLRITVAQRQIKLCYIARDDVGVERNLCSADRFDAVPTELGAKNVDCLIQ
jgi:hypothetical protein